MRFVDAHTHLEFFALKGLPIEKAKTKKDLIDMIQSAEKKPFVAYGWNEEVLGEAIERKDIDRFSFSVLLIRVDAHLGVINKKVMEELKLSPSEKFDPERGYVYEEVLWDITSMLKPKEIGWALIKGQEEALSKGIVEIHDFVDSNIAETYFKLREEGNLKLRVALMPYYKDYENVLRLIDKYGEDEFIRLGWIKIFVDGSIGARTAYLKEPYRDKTSRGILLKTEEELINIIKELEAKNLRVAIHAIGDGAIDVCLNAFERADIVFKGHRIEHAEMIDSYQAKRVKDMGIVLCIQPNFNPVFMQTYIKALGEDRAHRMNPLKMLDEMDVNMIFGTDMMPFDPEVGLKYASQILGKEKALHCYGGWKYKKFYSYS
ncbi:MAG: amidohydrolase [Thermodesulfobacteriota bacterium]